MVLVLALARDERGVGIGRHRSDAAAYVLAVAGVVVMLPLSFWWLDSFGRTNLLVQITAWQLRDVPGWALPIVVLGTAAVNSFIEELLYRGILLQTLRSWVSPAAAIVVQGVAFGLVHWVGIPGGWFGIAMTTVVGVLLDVIRYRTGSILLPWLLHLGGNLVSLGWIAFLLR